MSRGYKRDTIATAEAGFDDPRSFRSWPKDGQAHDLLFGTDKTRQRIEIFDHFGGICSLCGKFAGYGPGYNQGSWHHKESGPGERCDCIHNAEWRHLITCHLATEHKHPQLKWIPQEKA
jgi:hypothetical protein